MYTPQPPRRWLVRELLQLPESLTRHELLDGELIVTPAPAQAHQSVVIRLVDELVAYLRPLGRRETLFAGPADIWWDDHNLVQPDLLVLHPDDVTGAWKDAKRLLLAVEVLSPGTSRNDRGRKRALYQRHGVETYWIVDGETRVVEIWRPEAVRPDVAMSALRWQVVPDAPELVIDLPALFAHLPGTPRM